MNEISCEARLYSLRCWRNGAVCFVLVWVEEMLAAAMGTNYSLHEFYNWLR